MFLFLIKMVAKLEMTLSTAQKQGPNTEPQQIIGNTHKQ